MNWLQRHKLNGLGLTFLLLIFILSVYVRQENLKAPLQSEEWITAHTLITAEIWDENGGPSAFGFNPIYNYPGHGNAYRSALGGIVAENGEVYYVSYPPFTFLFYYYVSHVVGGPSVQSIRIISLLIHFLTSLLIFFLVQKIRSKKNQNTFNYGGIIAAGLYLFAKGNLRFHGNLYFADTLVQPLFIGCILLSLHYYKGEFKRENRTLIALFIVFFFAPYTEWIGLLTAFITGLFFLIKAIAHRNKHLLKPFFTIGIASSLALAITIAQYSSIDGWESLKTTTSTKYAERSGYDDQTNSAKEFNIHNSDTFSFLLKNFNANYEHTLNYFGFTTVLFLLFLRLRKFIKKPIEEIQQTNKHTFFVLTILILPLLLHYLLLFNFNAMHQFAALKTVSVLVILIGLMITKIQCIAKEIHPYVHVGSLVSVCLFFILQAHQSAERYLTSFNPQKKIDYERIATAKIMREESEPNTATFATMSLNPNLIYYAKHIYSPLKEFDAEKIFQIMDMRRNEYGDFYQHEEDGLHYIIRFRKLDRQIEIIDTLNY